MLNTRGKVILSLMESEVKNPFETGGFEMGLQLTAIHFRDDVLS